MSKRDFIALADAIRAHNHSFPQQHFTQDQIESLAFFCLGSNGRFKRDRWLGYIRGENEPNGGAVKSNRKEKETV